MQLSKTEAESNRFRKILQNLVGPGRVELPTSRLSGVRSNQLSYEPFNCGFQILDCGFKTAREKSDIGKSVEVG